MKEVLFNTHDLALIFTIFICLSFSVFLVTLKKGNKLSNYLLACFLLTQAAIPTDNLINFGEAFRAFALSLSPNLFYTFGLAFWLEVPLLLLYIKSLVNKNYQLKKRDSLSITERISLAWMLCLTGEPLFILQRTKKRGGRKLF